MAAKASQWEPNANTDEYKGMSLYNLGKYADAIVYFEKSIELYKKVNDIKKLALLWNSKGMAYESLGALFENQSNQSKNMMPKMPKKSKFEAERRESSMCSVDTIDLYGSDDLALKTLLSLIVVLQMRIKQISFVIKATLTLREKSTRKL